MRFFTGKYLLWLLGCGLLLACGPRQTLSPPGTSPSPTPPQGPVAHSLVFAIHGDGSYLYHDREGQALRADEGALQQALALGEGLPQAEVFVFHLKPARKFFFFWPQKDGTVYHFRGGQQIARKDYFWAKGDSVWGWESRFFRQNSVADGHTSKMFFFYGHEIPLTAPGAYHASHRHHPFSLTTFAEGLGQFYGGFKARPCLDLLTLSTCNNATPQFVATLGPLSRFILASPGRLHLSHIDSDILLPLLQRSDPGLSQLVTAFSREAFDRLCSRTETAVTLSLFETRMVLPGIESLLARFPAISPALPEGDCQDCQSFPQIGEDLPTLGVRAFYRPPTFGRQKDKQTHSGWGCRLITGPW